MVEKTGRFGKYLACPNYPKCSNIKPINQVVAKCPKCGKDIVKRISKKGKPFYTCTGYPDCDFISWDMPTGNKCPKCGEFTVLKTYKGKTAEKCVNKDCDFKQTLDGGEEK